MVKFCFFGDNSCVLIVPSWRGQEKILYRRADERYKSDSPISLVDQRQIGGRNHPDLAVHLTQRVRNLRGLRLTPHSAFFVCRCSRTLQRLTRTVKEGGRDYTEVIASPVMEPRRLNTSPEEQEARRNQQSSMFETHMVVPMDLGIMQAA